MQASPNWFVEKLKFSEGQNIFVIDDDQSIHGIWKGRLASARMLQSKISLYNFTSANDFINEYQSGQLPMNKDKNIFLVDYEFLEQDINGLEVIQKLGIAEQSILVTSRYEEKRILQSCNNLGVPLIPKGMVGFIPLE
jgi:response regulator of citrate/malate metabolism